MVTCKDPYDENVLAWGTKGWSAWLRLSKEMVVQVHPARLWGAMRTNQRGMYP